MPSIVSVSSYHPPHTLRQEETMEFARELFAESYKDIERLLTVFSNGDIKQRHFAVPLDWFQEEHSLEERNDLYIKLATEYSVKAIEKCLQNPSFLSREIKASEVDAIICVSSSGMATPSLDARIMNQLPFLPQTKRVPIWGLGCAGGAAGLSRAYDYCLAYPKATVLVVCVELCGLTFQRSDQSKSNLIGTSLFADGVAAALICGTEANVKQASARTVHPTIHSTQSTLMPDSEEVMGWDVKDNGLHVVFSRSIPSIVKDWLKPNVETFLENEGRTLEEISAFVAHPGGKKVLQAYEKALGFSEEMTAVSRKVLEEHGNMSSPTVLYVLEKFMQQERMLGEYGLVAALGPGFCSELLLVEWAGDVH
ncbi:type III polyketide synthase [Shouchella shacheensis]|uniref:type III polyketide synthase n=1 Tax=Shouchella shacheensis TaxID=1649580 RepID=UPI00073FE6F9|nr:3-oxoacyl-[acyl-carrier-protein] synthase III C-terminal domain-containing protein [Shouchella shacheensis]